MENKSDFHGYIKKPRMKIQWGFLLGYFENIRSSYKKINKYARIFFKKIFLVIFCFKFFEAFLSSFKQFEFFYEKYILRVTLILKLFEET